VNVVFITTESFMDHSFTMIQELKKHIRLETLFIAKELTPENKDFCIRLNAKFVKRKRFINPFRVFFELKLIFDIKKLNADVVWFNTLSFMQALLLMLFLRRALITSHDVEIHPEDKDFHGKLSQWLTFKIFKKRIAVMSRSQSDLFEKKFGLKPFLLRLPIIDYYESSAENKDAQPEKSEKVRFLFFGSIQPYKGLETLLTAAGILNSRNAEYELNICGRIRYNHDELNKIIAGLKNVKHLNKHIDYKDVYSIYNNSDVIVIPYLHVTQSGPLLIGYNQCKPCITSDLPGFREYVEERKSGLMFNNSPEDLADKMEKFINNKMLVNDMANFINTEIKSRFSMQSLSSSYIDVFKKHLR
jgi:glycosyltransferase involved in cell wall biosynthesis